MNKIIKISLLCALIAFLFSYCHLNSKAQDLNLEPTIEDELGKDIL